MQKSKLEVTIGYNVDTAAIKNNKYTYFYKRPLGHRKHSLIVRDNDSKEEAVMHGNLIRGLRTVLASANEVVRRDYCDASVDYYNGRNNKKGSELYIATDGGVVMLDGRQINTLKKVLEAI